MEKKKFSYMINFGLPNKSSACAPMKGLNIKLTEQNLTLIIITISYLKNINYYIMQSYQTGSLLSVKRKPLIVNSELTLAKNAITYQENIHLIHVIIFLYSS